MTTSHIPPIRQRPGAGVPWPLRFFGGRMLRILAPHQPIEDTIRRANELAEEIESTVAALTDEVARRRVLILPMRMLEDSSRDWSPAMTMEHLSIVGEHVVEGLGRLRRRDQIAPGAAVGTADVKPNEVGRDQALARFRAMTAGWRAEVEQAEPPPRGGPRFPHPWFGAFNYRQWCLFESVHRELHLRQIRRILHTGGASCE